MAIYRQERNKLTLFTCQAMGPYIYDKEMGSEPNFLLINETFIAKFAVHLFRLLADMIFFWTSGRSIFKAILKF